MTSINVIECNQLDADVVYENGDFLVNHAKPFIMEEGDELSLRLGSISTKQVSNESIVLLEDLQVSAAFAFYEFNYNVTKPTALPKAKKSNHAVEPTYDGKLYTLYYENSEYISAPYMKVEYTGQDPSAQYVQNANNIHIDMNVTYIDPSGMLNQKTIVADTYLRQHNPLDPYFECYPVDGTTNINYVVNGGEYPGTDMDGTLKINSVNMYYGYPEPDPNNQISVKLGKSGNFFFAPWAFQGQRTIDFSGRSMVLGSYACTIPAGVYDPESIAIKLTDLLNQGNPVVPVHGVTPYPNSYTSDNGFLVNLLNYDEQPAEDKFFHNGDINNDYFYTGATIGNGAIQVGASNVVVEYGKSGNIFQLSQSFTPLVSENDAGQPSTGIYHTADGFFKIPQATGIVFTDLQPTSFWQDTLGLRSKLVCPVVASPHHQNILSNPESYIPYAPFVNSDFLPALDRAGLKPADTPAFFSTTGLDNIAILGDPPTSGDDYSGYLIVEVICPGLDGNYVGANENRRFVVAVVPKQYIQFNTITGFGSDCAIPYIHKGQSVMLTNMRVRILDGYTKQVSDNLNDKNTMIMNLVKPIQASAPTPTSTSTSTSK